MVLSSSFSNSFSDACSKRALQIKPSATLSIAAKAQQLKLAGHDIISLSTGEPDFDTPDHIKAKAIEAIQKGLTKYTAVEGIASLRDAVVEKFKRENQLSFERSEILISTGCKQAIYNALQALLNPGDEVLIPAPYWVSYPDMTLLADGIPVILETTQASRFKITPEQLEHAINPNTKVLFLNSPSNPSGMAYSPEELKALAEVLLKHPQVWIFSDDIYEHVYWGTDPFHNMLMVEPALRSRTIIFNGVSKSYAMTGWRIGYSAAPREITAIMANIQSQSTSNPCSIAQAAAEEALRGDQSAIKIMKAAFHSRHDRVLASVNALPNWSMLPCDGAFYAFVNVAKSIEAAGFSPLDDLAFCDWILDKALVALVPGTAFGARGFIRISYATSQAQLDTALARIAAVLHTVS